MQGRITVACGRLVQGTCRAGAAMAARVPGQAPGHWRSRGRMPRWEGRLLGARFVDDRFHAARGNNRRWRSCREATVLVGGVWRGGDARRTNVEVKGEGADLIEFP